jgi:hypothetical protein
MAAGAVRLRVRLWVRLRVRLRLYVLRLYVLRLSACLEAARAARECKNNHLAAYSTTVTKHDPTTGSTLFL